MDILRASFAELLSFAEVFVAGLRKHLDKLTRRSIDEAFVQGIETLKGEVESLNNEQESLKGRLKLTTKQLNEKIDALIAQLSEAKKIVKLDIDPALWRELGIDDKR